MDKNTRIMEFLEAGKGTASCFNCKMNWKAIVAPKECPFCKDKAVLFVAKKLLSQNKDWVN